jgi:hypothetical protein
MMTLSMLREGANQPCDQESLDSAVLVESQAEPVAGKRIPDIFLQAITSSVIQVLDLTLESYAILKARADSLDTDIISYQGRQFLLGTLSGKPCVQLLKLPV